MLSFVIQLWEFFSFANCVCLTQIQLQIHFCQTAQKLDFCQFPFHQTAILSQIFKKFSINIIILVYMIQAYTAGWLITRFTKPDDIVEKVVQIHLQIIDPWYINVPQENEMMNSFKRWKYESSGKYSIKIKTKHCNFTRVCCLMFVV